MHFLNSLNLFYLHTFFKKFCYFVPDVFIVYDVINTTQNIFCMPYMPNIHIITSQFNVHFTPVLTEHGQGHNHVLLRTGQLYLLK